MGSAGYSSANNQLSTLGLGYRAENGGWWVDNIEYNNFEFPPNSRATVTCVPEYDKTGRTVLYNNYAITVDFVVTPTDIDSGTTDTTMNSLRSRLSAPGRGLNFTSFGYGYLEVNTDSSLSYTDADFGPKPQVVEWQPVAGRRAANVTWLCTTKVPACSSFNTDATDGGVIQWRWSISTNTDQDGISSRTINGVFTILQKRPDSTLSTDPRAGTAITVPVDRIELILKEQIIGSFLPPRGGFHRTVNWNLSESKTHVEWSITDTEIVSSAAYPDAINDLDMKQSISSTLPLGFMTWKQRISANVTVPKFENITMETVKKRAYTQVGAIIADRIERITKGNIAYTMEQVTGKASTASLGDDNTKSAQVIIIPHKYELQDDMYSNTFSLDTSYEIICPKNLIFLASGILTTPGSGENSWSLWRSYRTVNGFYGNQSAIELVPGTDTIVDFCTPLNLPGEEAEDSRQDTPGRSDATPDISPEEEEGSKNNEYLGYINNVKLIRDNGTIVQIPLSQQSNAPNEIAIGPVDTRGTETNLVAAAITQAGATPTVYRSRDAVYTVEMSGYAMRLGAPTPVPNLLRFGGAELAKIGKDVYDTKPMTPGSSAVEGSPTIFLTTWKKSYVCLSQPNGSVFETTGTPNNAFAGV